MNVIGGSEVTAPANRTTVERRSDRELVVTRSFDAPARIVWEAWTRPDLLKRWWAPRSLGVTTATLEERGSKTRLVLHALYPSKEALDGAVASGMERGMRDTYEQLEQLVGTLA